MAKVFMFALSMLLVASVVGQQRQVTLVVGQNPGGQLELNSNGITNQQQQQQQQVNELQVTPGQQQQQQQAQQQQQQAEVEGAEEEEDGDEVEEQVVNGLLEWLDKKKKKKKEKKRGEKQEKKRRRKKERQPLIIPVPVQPSEPRHEKKVIHIHINIVKKDEHKHKKDGGYHHEHDKHYGGKHSWPLLSHHHNWDADFGQHVGAGDQHDEYGGYASNQVANYTAPNSTVSTSTSPRPSRS